MTQDKSAASQNQDDRKEPPDKETPEQSQARNILEETGQIPIINFNNGETIIISHTAIIIGYQIVIL